MRIRTALLFPGSGSHYEGMGQVLYDRCSAARQTFEEAEDTAGLPFKSICMGASTSELNRLEIAQAAIVVCSVAAYRAYMQEVGLAPEYAAGHSLGEYSALIASGAISLGAGLRLVRLRSLAMENAAAIRESSVIAVTGPSHAEVRAQVRRISLERAEEIADVACFNTRTQTVISGDKKIIHLIGSVLEEERGARVAHLSISVPVHSRLMLPAVDTLREVLSGAEIQPSKWPVISNVTALPHGDANSTRELLAQQLISPVRWLETMSLLQSRAVTHTVELGPKSTLTSFANKIARNLKAYASDTVEHWEAIQQLNNARGSLYGRCMALAVAAPNHCIDTDEYERGVVEPYRRLAELDHTVDSSLKELSSDPRKEALQLLGRILTTKGMSQSEQLRRISQLTWA